MKSVRYARASFFVVFTVTLLIVSVLYGISSREQSSLSDEECLSMSTNAASLSRPSNEVRESLLEQLAPQTRQVVRRDSWSSDNTVATLHLLAAIAGADCGTSTVSFKQRFPGFVSEPVAILQSAESEGWFRDGLSEDEKRLLTAFYQTYSRLPADNPGQLLSDALQRHRYRAELSGSTTDWYVIVVGQDDSTGIRSLDLTTEYLPRLNVLFGQLRFGQPPVIGVTVLMKSGLNGEICGQSYADFGTIVINLWCRLYPLDFVIAHELTHIYLRGRYPWWYTEGVAHFWAANLTSREEQVSEEMNALLDRIHATNAVLLESNMPGGGSQDAAGFLFLTELDKVLGHEKMRLLSVGVRPDATGAEILQKVRSLATAAELQDVERIIASRVTP